MIIDNTFSSVTTQLGLRLSSVRYFLRDFGIFSETHLLVGSRVLSQLFVDYLKKYSKFLLEYQSDYYSDKSPDIIAKTINRDVDEVLVFLIKTYPQYFDNKVFNKHMKYPFRYISSYGIDYLMGGNYEYLKNYFNREICIDESNMDSEIEISLKIIGYEDILTSIKEQLEPILSPTDKNDWGLDNPGGILLFGPPGCGKSFWAKNICDLIKYDFEEIPRSVFGSTYVDGAMMKLKEVLNELMKKSRILVFFDEFDSIAASRNNQSSGSTENAKVVNTLLQEIPKLIERQIILVAASNYLDYLDSAVIRPGRFDLKIPVFPPNIEEKAKLIVSNMSGGLNASSPLKNILEFNGANYESFWKEISSKMILYSTSLVIDYCQVLKRRLKALYRDNASVELIIDERMLDSVLIETSSKITKKDAEIFSQFYNEVKSLGSNYYQERLDWLFDDLNKYYSKFKSDPPRPIGYRKPNVSL